MNQGRSMPRKRKYADPGAGEGPDGLRTPAAKPAADAGHHTSPHCKGEHAPMETTPKGKGSMAADGMASVKVEEHDGSYDCLLCAESVRGAEARHCSACTVQPWHVECGPELIACPQCARDNTVVPWRGRYV